jgi:hypothetical protein
MQKEQTRRGTRYPLKNDQYFYVAHDYRGVSGCGFGERVMNPFPDSREWKHNNKLARIEELLELCSTREDVEMVFNIPAVEVLDKSAVVGLMEATTTMADWDKACDRVKAAFDGEYPGFWYMAILASGLAGRKQRGW